MSETKQLKQIVEESLYTGIPTFEDGLTVAVNDEELEDTGEYEVQAASNEDIDRIAAECMGWERKPQEYGFEPEQTVRDWYYFKEGRQHVMCARWTPTKDRNQSAEVRDKCDRQTFSCRVLEILAHVADPDCFHVTPRQETIAAILALQDK